MFLFVLNLVLLQEGEGLKVWEKSLGIWRDCLKMWDKCSLRKDKRLWGIPEKGGKEIHLFIWQILIVLIRFRHCTMDRGSSSENIPALIAFMLGPQLGKECFPSPSTTHKAAPVWHSASSMQQEQTHLAVANLGSFCVLNLDVLCQGHFLDHIFDFYIPLPPLC